jgi:hypothetical protein
MKVVVNSGEGEMVITNEGNRAIEIETQDPSRKSARQVEKAYAIESRFQVDESGDPLLWSNALGWSEKGTIFCEEEKKGFLNLPPGGKWTERVFLSNPKVTVQWHPESDTLFIGSPAEVVRVRFL